MITRTITPHLHALARHYPVLTVTGPRQAGKTTLCRMAFPGLPYVSLERLAAREYARSDPAAFLAEYRGGAVLDEVHNAPELLGDLQVAVDEDPTPGRFVLTGSQHLGLLAGVSQSLAGRAAVVHLMPPGLDELRRFPVPPRELIELLWTGAYPRIHDRGIPAGRWLADYLTTYVQRDVRQVLNVGDLDTFTLFVRLCAGRTAQVLNLSALASDCGVTHNTARAWLSVLETGFLAFRLPPWHRNIKKQLTKSPKLHMVDTGLACSLLGIRSPDELRHHPLRGALFESWVVAEVRKAWLHAGHTNPPLAYFRDHKGLEVDLLWEQAGRLRLVEAKSGQTVARDAAGPLRRVSALVERAGLPVVSVSPTVVYGGDDPQRRTGLEVVPWSGLPELLSGEVPDSV